MDRAAALELLEKQLDDEARLLVGILDDLARGAREIPGRPSLTHPRSEDDGM